MKLEEINLRDPIRIGYYDPFDAFPLIQNDFNSTFPLSNLHWRYNPLKPVKSIPLLPVKFEEEFPSLHSTKSPECTASLDNVYARLMFLKVADIDTYRSQVRPLIIEWFKALVKPQNVQWAIILVIPAGKKDKKSTVIKMSIYDKLRLDFGPGGKRVVMLDMASDDPHFNIESRQHVLIVHEKYEDEISKLDVYKDVVGTVKLLVLQTFNLRYIKSSSLLEKLKLTSIDNPAGRLKLFQERLKLARIFCDIRCLDESLELYQELYTELKTANFDVTKSTSRLPLDKIDYTAFDPENMLASMDPYIQFCLAVEKREPINIAAVKLGLFIKISVLLQMLANFATSISISSVFISSLLQKLIGFLNDYAQHYPDSLETDQWLYAMAEFYLKLPLAQKLVELDKRQSENNDDVGSTTGILEYSAELELFRRLVLNGLAAKKGYALPTECLFLDQVSLLQEPPSIIASEDFKIAVSELSLGLQCQQSYEDLFEKLTISAIQDYAMCERIKTIDVLSIDLAILHYRRREHKDALDILQSSHDYFIQNGWNFVGGMLLEIFLDCIENVVPESTEHFLNTTLRLIASLNCEGDCHTGINDYNLVKNKSERSRLFHKLTALSMSLGTCHEFALEDIFAVDICPYIDVQQDTGRYLLRADIRNKIGIQIELLRVVVTLTTYDCPDENSITFTTQGVTVKENHTTTIELYTNTFSSNIFKVESILVHITEKLVFSASIEHPQEGADDTVVHYTEPAVDRSSSPKDGLLNVLLLMFPFPGQFRLEVLSPKKFNLGATILECVIHNGPKQINNLSLLISTSTHRLQILKEPKRFEYEKMNANEDVNVSFECNPESRIVEVQIVCQYEKSDEKFEYHLRGSYDLSLKISVSVQDIFRESSIYSKFQIGCANSQNPVRVNKCDYSCSQGKYNVTSLKTAAMTDGSLIVYGEQPAYIFYKLVPTIDRIDASDTLDFTILYSDLHKECEQSVYASLRQELTKREKLKYIYLLSPAILELQFDLLRYSVDRVIRASNVPKSSTLMNERVSKHVPPEEQLVLSDVLSLLFEDTVLRTHEQLDADIEYCELYIPVSVPYLSMLHRTEFLLESKSHFVVTEPIKATLVVHSSSKWADLSSGKLLAISSPSQASATPKRLFELTVLNEEDWLISGLTRLNFHVDEGETTTDLDLCLIPLNVGELPLPKVAIKAFNNTNHAMNLVQENAFESVLVIPELENATFAF